VVIVIPDHDRQAVKSFTKGLAAAHWKVTSRAVSYLDIGNSIANSCLIITAVHSSCASSFEPLVLKSPPTIAPPLISSFLWAPFDQPEHALGYGIDNVDFNKDTESKMAASTLKPTKPSASPGVRIKYYLHCNGHDASILAGSVVLLRDRICPPFESCPNQNLFQQFFGIEFHYESHTYIRAISTYEFARCFNLVENIQYCMSHERDKFGLDAAMPGRTWAWLFEYVHSHLVYLHDTSSEIFSANQFAAPAAMIQTLVNGAICTCLPLHNRWVQAYASDPDLCAVCDLALNPSKMTNNALSKVNHNYRRPLHQSIISIKNDMLILRKPIVGTSSFTCLQLVPAEIVNIIFIAFHTNLIGGHLNAYQTLHCLQLHFYWPRMYSYIKQMCQACPGCVLANPTSRKSSKLVYNFPIEAPFLVMFFNAYSAGKYVGYEGSECYLIGCCGMCSFACMEPITRASATTFASAIMKILLRYGFCHTVVLNKDSKFFGVCREAINLLKLNCHVLSSANHNPMIVERVNWYLMKGLKIMCNERGSVRVALEAILLLLYTWNSCLVPGTDISCSLVAVGREFAFPIDFSTNNYWELASLPSTVVTYSNV
jgi:hypothetical protein